MTFFRFTPLALAGLLLGSTAAFAGTATIGVLGDSVADEYQFYPTQQAAQGFVEILAARQNDPNTYDFGAFTTESRGEPRNAGYEYNWARSGARTDEIRPQVEGLATQVAAGQVKYGMMFVGSNNFRDVLTSGADPVESARGGIANTVAAAGALLAASPDFKLAVANVPDITLTPAARAALAADPSLAPAYADVRSLIDTYNDTLEFQFANVPRVSVVDANALLDQLSTGTSAGGTTLDPLTPGPSPSNLYVDPVHPGTTAQSLLADAFLNELGLLEQTEPVPGPNPNPDPGPDPGPTPIPLPAGVWAAIACAPFVVAGRRRLKRSAGRVSVIPKPPPAG